jgi:hypothetical protein
MPKAEIVPDQLTLQVTPEQAILLHRSLELLQKQISQEPGFNYHTNTQAASGSDMAQQLLKSGEQLKWLLDFDQSVTAYCHAKGYRPFPHCRYL